MEPSPFQIDAVAEILPAALEALVESAVADDVADPECKSDSWYSIVMTGA
jgi:hypothetical protein